MTNFTTNSTRNFTTNFTESFNSSTPNLSTLNATSVYTFITAEEYNAKTLYIRIAAIIFLGILIPAGIIGNASVIYIYGFCLNKSNIHFFIVFLGIFDIISSAVGMPLEMAEMFYMNTYSSEALCKIQRLVNYSCNIGSAGVLLAISLERYIKVCRSTKTQLTRKHCKFMSLGIVILCVALASPISYGYDRLPVKVDGNITVYKCTFSSSPIIFTYYMGLFPACILNLIVIFSLYYFVLRSARRHFMQLQNRRNVTRQSNIDLSSFKRRYSRTNISVICLTAVYALSFTPTLIIGMFTTFFTVVDYSPPVRGILILMYRSWALNCSINPLVYGFFNKPYRKTFTKMAKKLCGKDSKISSNKDYESTSAIESRM